MEGKSISRGSGFDISRAPRAWQEISFSLYGTLYPSSSSARVLSCLSEVLGAAVCVLCRVGIIYFLFLPLVPDMDKFLGSGTCLLFVSGRGVGTVFAYRTEGASGNISLLDVGVYFLFMVVMFVVVCCWWTCCHVCQIPVAAAFYFCFAFCR